MSADGGASSASLRRPSAGQLAHRLQREGVVVEIMEGVDEPHIGAAVRGKGDAALQHVAGTRIIGLRARDDDAVGRAGLDEIAHRLQRILRRE